jgi:PII-like signaling protein
MSIHGEQVLMRVYLDSADRPPHSPTFEELVRTARKFGVAGATVLRGILGFGPHGSTGESKWSLVEHVPVILETVDSAEKIQSFIEGPVERIMHRGMVTLERANVMMYRYREQDTGQDQAASLCLGQLLEPLSTVPRITPRGHMQTSETGVLLRVYIGDSDRFEGKPLYEAIVQKARETGLAGATVLRGSEGFGAHSVVHTAKILGMSTDLPIVIEIVDEEEKIKLLLPHLETMVQEGMVTMEHVMILSYRPGAA